jgi:ligand-binding sensor domain-containing protein
VIDSNNNIFVAANKQVWEYPNSGNAWIPVGTQTPDSGAINSLALDQQNNLYIATYNGFNGYVFKYISSSRLWQVLGTGIFNGVGIVTTDSSGNLYIVAPSTNNGLLTTVSTYSGDAFLPSYSGNYAPLFGNNAVVTGM